MDFRKDVPPWALAALLMALGLGLLWYFQTAVGNWLAGTKPVPVSEPVLLYTWTDRDGTVHFSQTGDGHSHVIVARADHITRLEPLPEPPSHHRLHLPAIGNKGVATGQSASGETGDLHARMNDKVVNDDN